MAKLIINFRAKPISNNIAKCINKQKSSLIYIFRLWAYAIAVAHNNAIVSLVHNISFYAKKLMAPKIQKKILFISGAIYCNNDPVSLHINSQHDEQILYALFPTNFDYMKRHYQ